MANKTENRRVNLYINGKEVKNSIRGIQAEYKKLVNEQKDMIRGTKEYQAHAKRIQQLKKLMDQHYNSVHKTAGAWDSLKKAANGFNQYFTMIAAGIATMTGLVMAFRKAADAANLFEERVDNLSALTGLEGDQLGWLADKAKETSVALIENGIRIKQSAADIVDAYTKMGSQRPELLKHKEALHQVTMNAIILSEAAKGKLEPSVTALATVMNQFGLQAQNSRDAINTIAAGSKAGAADIDYLSTALEKSGTSLALLGISVEEGVALVETVAPKFKQARVAGNGLDKVFLKLRDKGIGFKNGVFDINTALEELRVRFSKGESSAELFGVEHAKMVEVLVQGQSEFNRYLDLVTDTEVALEQAAKNTNNRASALAQAKNKITLLAIELGEQLSPAMTKAYLGFGTLMKVAITLPKIIKENQTTLIALGGALLAYNAKIITNIALSAKQIAQKYGLIAVDKLSLVFGKEGLIVANARAVAARTSIALTGKMTMAQGRAIATQKALNASMKANPVGVLIMGITALVTGIRLYNKYNSRAISLEREKKALTSDLVDLTNSLESSYEGVNDQVSKLNRLSYQQKLDLQDKINKTIELAEAELALLKARKQEIQNDIEPTWWDEFVYSAESLWVEMWQGENTAYQAAGETYFNKLKNRKQEATAEIDDYISQVQDQIDKIKNSGSSLYDILNAETNADAIGSGSLVELQEKMNLYQLALSNTNRESEAFIRLQEKIKKTEEQMKAFGGNYSTQDQKDEAERLAKEKERIERELVNAVDQLRRKLHLDTLSDQQKEIQQANYKYDDLLAKAEAYGLDITAITDLRDQEIDAIEKKWAEQTAKTKADVQQKIDAILRSDRQTAVHEATKKYQDLIKLAEEYGLETAELYQAMQEELSEIQSKTFSDEEGTKVDIFGMTEEQWNKTLEQLSYVINMAQQFGEIWSSVNARRTAEENASMADYEAHIEKRKELLEKQLEEGLISQEQYNRMTNGLDEQLDQKKKDLARKQWERDREMRLYSAIINTAAGVTQALGSMPPPYSYILAALTAVLGGVQIAAISNEPTPAFKYGGYTPDRPTMALVGDGYKKEWVASGDLVSDPSTGPIIQELENYQRGISGSVRFSAPIQPRLENVSASALPSFASAGGSSESAGFAAILEQMVLMNENNARMNDYLSDPQNRRSTISYDHWKEYEEELSDMQSLSRMHG